VPPQPAAAPVAQLPAAPKPVSTAIQVCINATC
jgi:hypothetical protein